MVYTIYWLQIQWTDSKRERNKLFFRVISFKKSGERNARCRIRMLSPLERIYNFYFG